MRISCFIYVVYSLICIFVSCFSLKNMVGLKTLDLSESWFEGALPACIFELTSVTDLQLKKCHLRSLPS